MNNYDLGEDRNMCRFLACQYWDFEKEKCIYNYCKKLLENKK